MIDADIETAIKLVLDTRLPAVGLANILVAQSFNPTTQGTSLLPAVVFTKILSRRYGFQGQKYVLIPGDPATFNKTEVYYSRDTYQLSGFMDQDVSEPASLNAFDVLDTCATIFQSSEGRAIFEAADIGVDRVMGLRTPRSMDDSDRFQMDTSFDVILSYKNQLASVVPGALVPEGTVERV